MNKTDRPLLQCQKTVKRFGSFVVLKDVDIEIRKGEVVGIAGPNGAGKTMLFSVICGLEKASGGRIIFNGRDITNFKPHVIRKLGIAKTFQIPTFFSSLSVYENIWLAAHHGFTSRDNINDRVIRLISELNLDKNEKSATLSLIDKKKLMLGMALASEPRLILIDEIMAGLNPMETNMIMESITNMAQKGVSVGVIEHKLHTLLKLCNRLFVLHHGEKIAEGIPSEVVEDERVVSVYVGRGKGVNKG